MQYWRKENYSHALFMMYEFEMKVRIEIKYTAFFKGNNTCTF